jgi:hypothetical protein
MTLCLILLATLCACAYPITSARALTDEEIALLNKPERQKILEEGAKKEGKVVWYARPLLSTTDPERNSRSRVNGLFLG